MKAAWVISAGAGLTQDSGRLLPPPSFSGFPWPDAFSYGPDGMLYVVINQLHKGPVLNAGNNETKPPFLIIRFKPLAPGITGR